MGASVGVIAREEMDRPMDASDITSVEKGQEEVQRIRRLVTELYSSESKVLAADSSTASLSHLQIGLNGDLAPAGYDSPRQGAGKGGGGGGGGGGARPGGSGALRRRSTSFDRRRRRSLGGPGAAAPLSPADVLARRAQGADLAVAYVEWAAAAAAEEQGGGAASPQPPPLDTAAALDCLRLLPAEAALRAQRLLPYAEAHAAGLLVPGSAVLGRRPRGGGGGGPRVLFVSHRWYRAEDPDPDGRAFAVLSAFLRKRGRRVTHVWLACSCADPTRSVAHARRLTAAARRRSSLSPRPPTGGDLAAGPGAAAEAAASATSPHRGSFGSLDSGSPPKSSRANGGGDGGPAEGGHLLALLAATDLLLLPAVRRHSGGGGGRGGGWASDLGDFLSRGTLRAEAALGLLAGADATLALHWSPSPEEETKDGGGGGDAGPPAGGGGGTFWARCDWGAEGRKTYVLAAGRAARALAAPPDRLPDTVADGWLGAAAAAGGGPAALAAPFAAALDAVQADPLLRRRLRSGRAHEGDLASRPAVAQAAARAGEFASEADRLQCARTALQALLFLAAAARPGADRLGLREEKRPDQNLNIIGEDDEGAITRK